MWSPCDEGGFRDGQGGLGCSQKQVKIMSWGRSVSGKQRATYQ